LLFCDHKQYAVLRWVGDQNTFFGLVMGQFDFLDARQDLVPGGAVRQDKRDVFQPQRVGRRRGRAAIAL
jgi:hypothetical protein